MQEAVTDQRLYIPLNTETLPIQPPSMVLKKLNTTRMWANAQRDGRPAEYRWHPLVQHHKVWLTPATRVPCSKMLPRHESCWNLHGCPKLPDRSQPLVGRSSPYCGDMWRRHCCLTSFFLIVDTCLSCEDIAQQSCVMVPRWRFFASFIFSKQRAARFRPASKIRTKATPCVEVWQTSSLWGWD